MTTNTHPDRVELWVQPMPEAELRPLIEGLRTLWEAGDVAAVQVRRWDRYVDADGPASSPAWRRLGRFLRYAGPDADFAPAVTVGVGRMGPPRRVRHVPVATLAEYRDGRLVHLTPCDADAACVRRRLAALAAGERTPPAPRDGAPLPVPTA
jgi:hypothetical protein